jgi:hypothetical protein
VGSRILTLQRQARELGRLRTGWSVPHADPSKRPVPVKSKTWVITSHAEHYVAAAAKLWGGTVEQWKPQGAGAAQFRVVTEAESIDAILPPGDPLSQYNEMWNKGGCMRRCDGQTEQLTRKSCLCLAQFGENWHLQSKGVVCSATSRINVILPDMPDVGVWRAETHSFYAANEWGGTLDMVLSGTNGQGMVPVSLRIEPRQRVANGQTKHFPVVVVEIRGITPRQALTGPLPTAVALDPTAPQPKAIEAPRPDYIAEAEGGLTSEDVRDVWRTALENGDVDRKGTDELSKRLMAIAERIDAEADKPDQDGAYEAEIVEDPADYTQHRPQARAATTNYTEQGAA